MPQGRGKLERLFGTISELLCGLPGWLAAGSAKPATVPALSQLDRAISRFLVEDYNQRAHSETKRASAARWVAGGWLPRMPDSPEQLDMLLLSVARPRVVQRDGIRFEGQRYLALTLAAWIGEPVTIRYDPRDLAEIGVYHDDRFICRPVSPELAAQTISLKDLQAARSARRRQLATQLAERREHADKLLAAAPDQFLRARPELAEVNFWHPSGGRFAALQPGEPFFVKLKAPHNAIGGFGLFAGFERLPVWLAWDVFGQANGTVDEHELLARLRRLTAAQPSHDSGAGTGAGAARPAGPYRRARDVDRQPGPAAELGRSRGSHPIRGCCRDAVQAPQRRPGSWAR